MKKVFVANDDFGFLYEVNTWFTRKGFYVRTFSHSRSLFDALEESLPDLIMLDASLSGENGKEIYKKIKTRYHNSVSVILSSEEESVNKKTKDVFADGTLNTPFNLDEVSHLLNTSLLQ